MYSFTYRHPIVPEHLLKRLFFSPIKWLCHPCWKSNENRNTDLFLDNWFYPIDLHVYLYVNDTPFWLYSFAGSFEIKTLSPPTFFPPTFLWLFRIPCNFMNCSTWILVLAYQFVKRDRWDFENNYFNLWINSEVSAF